MSVYIDREQTQAKHFILRGYRQELAYKVLRGWDIAYVDGFSGPWESKTADFSDASFMIALGVLKEAQRITFEQTRVRRKIRCFFSEERCSLPTDGRGCRAVPSACRGLRGEDFPR
jgi:hypothetical protein